MWRGLSLGAVVWVAVACSSPPPTPVAATPTPVATPAATPTLPMPAPTPTPRPVASPTPTTTRAVALLTVETTAAVQGPGFLTPVELELEFQQSLSDQDQLRLLVEGVQQLNGIASVRSDGHSIRVRYDSTRVLPARIRDRLRELGHPALAGTDVQNPGDAAD